jgi:hypothetical protein
MSMGATTDRGVPHTQAYSLERRWSDIRKFLDRQSLHGELLKVRPGFVAATSGGGLITKDEVKDEIRARNEAGGMAK